MPDRNEAALPSMWRSSIRLATAHASATKRTVWVLPAAGKPDGTMRTANWGSSTRQFRRHNRPCRSQGLATRTAVDPSCSEEWKRSWIEADISVGLEILRAKA